jgi:hypothetical protein
MKSDGKRRGRRSPDADLVSEVKRVKAAHRRFKAAHKRFKATCRRDCRWFRDHPAQAVRWREAVADEFGRYEDRVQDLHLGCVLVVRLDGSHHVRLAFGEGVLVVQVGGVETPQADLVVLAHMPARPKVYPAEIHELCLYEADRLGVEATWREIFEHYADLEPEGADRHG